MTSDVRPGTITTTVSAHKAGTPCRILDLPYDIQIEIFSYLSWKTHVVCMDVCTLWRQTLITPHARAKRFSTDCDPRVHQIFKSVFLRHTSILQVAYYGGEIASVRFKKSADEYDDSHYEREDRLLWNLELWRSRHPILDDHLFSQEGGDEIPKEPVPFYQLAVEGIKLVVPFKSRPMSRSVSTGTWTLESNPKIKRTTLRECIKLLTMHAIKIRTFKERSLLTMDLLPNGVDNSSLLTVRMKIGDSLI